MSSQFLAEGAVERGVGIINVCKLNCLQGKGRYCVSVSVLMLVEGRQVVVNHAEFPPNLSCV